MPNHLAGSEIATTTYRILGPVLGRMVPPWRPTRAVPEGLCSWGDLWKASLINGAAWGLPMGLRLVPGHGRIARMAGAAAQVSSIRCPGMDVSTGELAWIPTATWLTTPSYGGTFLPPERAAISGGLLRIPGDGGAVVEPLLLLRDLALLLGAANPPAPPPASVLDAIREHGHARPRRRERDPASPPPDDGRTTWKAGTDPWDEAEDEAASASGDRGPAPSGSEPLGAGARAGARPVPLEPGARVTPADVAHDDPTGPGQPGPAAPPAPSARRGPTTGADADGRDGAGTGTNPEGDASPFRESSADRPGEGAEWCGRSNETEIGDDRRDHATTVSREPPETTATGSMDGMVGTAPAPARKARVPRRTGIPARADHLLFPKAREWVGERRSFASVADLCGRLSDWLLEAHGETMQPGSIEGALRKRGGPLLDEICPPAPLPAGVPPNGRPRAGSRTPRD